MESFPDAKTRVPDGRREGAECPPPGRRFTSRNRRFAPLPGGLGQRRQAEGLAALGFDFRDGFSLLDQSALELQLGAWRAHARKAYQTAKKHRVRVRWRLGARAAWSSAGAQGYFYPSTMSVAYARLRAYAELASRAASLAPAASRVR